MILVRTFFSGKFDSLPWFHGRKCCHIKFCSLKCEGKKFQMSFSKIMEESDQMRGFSKMKSVVFEREIEQNLMVALTVISKQCCQKNILQLCRAINAACIEAKIRSAEKQFFVETTTNTSENRTDVTNLFPQQLPTNGNIFYFKSLRINQFTQRMAVECGKHFFTSHHNNT